MVQVVSVSAHTAAYAAEALKPSARVSGTAPSERTVKAIAREAEKSGDADRPSRPSLPNVVQPPSISLFFLTAQRQPDNTYQRAHEEYLQALAEYRVEHRDVEDDEDAVSD